MTHELDVPSSASSTETFVLSEEALQRIFNAWQQNGCLEGEMKSEWRELRARAMPSLSEDEI